MTGAPPPLTSNETAHLWFLDTGTFDEPSVRDRWLERLEPYERLRYAAHGTPAGQSGYLATRALARTALAHYTGQPAERLRFRSARGERPGLESPAMPGLSFSLARTRGLAVGLFALDLDVGVDVELVTAIEGGEAVELAAKFFSSRELAELSSLEDAARLPRFYELWTLREAYLKARGVGLTLPLDELVFQPAGAGTVRADFGPAIGDDPERWQFELIGLGERHLAATCVQRPISRTAGRTVSFDARAVTFGAGTRDRTSIGI